MTFEFQIKSRNAESGRAPSSPSALNLTSRPADPGNESQPRSPNPYVAADLKALESCGLIPLKRLSSEFSGHVWLCEDQSKVNVPPFARHVAVKWVPRSAARFEKANARFIEEGRLAARLTHPNILSFDRWEAFPDGRPFGVMPFMPGGSMEDRREANKKSESVARETMIHLVRVARALEAAHEKGIIHRDVKPSNVLYDSNGEVKLADFGLAKPLVDDRHDASKSDPKFFVGTLRYLSPEQVKSIGPLSPKLDVFALGTILFELATGRHPYEGLRVIPALVRLGKLDEPSPDPRHFSSALDPRTADVIDHAMQKDPLRRPTAREFAETLEEALGH